MCCRCRFPLSYVFSIFHDAYHDSHRDKDDGNYYDASSHYNFVYIPLSTCVTYALTALALIVVVTLIAIWKLFTRELADVETHAISSVILTFTEAASTLAG